MARGKKEINITQKTFPWSNCILCYRILPDAIVPTLQHGKVEKRDKYHSENIPMFQLYTVLLQLTETYMVCVQNYGLWSHIGHSIPLESQRKCKPQWYNTGVNVVLCFPISESYQTTL